ncbi:MAG: hypothetical protein J7D60_08315 [Prosthecochloris sp.]|nr:hypothetical protein [Prosthecochloris sp.]
MFKNENPDNKLPQTLIRSCSCGNYHLHYRYVMLTIPGKTLFHIMEECYEWEEMRAHVPEVYLHKPFRLMVGLCTIAILPEDFPEFNEAVQRCANEALNLDDLLQQTKTR